MRCVAAVVGMPVYQAAILSTVPAARIGFNALSFVARWRFPKLHYLHCEYIACYALTGPTQHLQPVPTYIQKYVTPHSWTTYDSIDDSVTMETSVEINLWLATNW
jgi:hypothetical protein